MMRFQHTGFRSLTSVRALSLLATIKACRVSTSSLALFPTGFSLWSVVGEVGVATGIACVGPVSSKACKTTPMEIPPRIAVPAAITISWRSSNSDSRPSSDSGTMCSSEAARSAPAAKMQAYERLILFEMQPDTTAMIPARLREQESRQGKTIKVWVEVKGASCNTERNTAQGYKLHTRAPFRSAAIPLAASTA